MFQYSQVEKNMRRGYIALAFSLSTAAFAQSDFPQDRNPDTNSPSYNDSENKIYIHENAKTSNTVLDQDLTNTIREKLAPGVFSNGYPQIHVQVNAGIVTLQGSVPTQADQDKIEKEVRNIDGVKSVKSNLLIQNATAQRDFNQDTYANASGDQLNTLIRDEVSRGWLWNSYKEVILNTSNGAVTLEGTIDSINDQKKLMNEIQKIDGVRSIKSNLKIINN